MDKPKLTVVESIPSADQEDIRGVIDVLERALAEAREGKILSVAVTTVGPQCKFGFYSAQSARHMASLVASVGLTHWRLCEDAWHTLDVTTEEYTDPPTTPEAS